MTHLFSKNIINKQGQKSSIDLHQEENFWRERESRERERERFWDFVRDPFTIKIL